MPYSGTPEEQRAKRRRYRETHRDQINDAHRAWTEANRDQVRARRRAYYEVNRQAIIDDAKRRRLADPERWAEYQARYRETHRDEIRGRARTRDRTRTNTLRRQRRQADPVRTRATSQRERHGITPEQWHELWTAQGGLCWLCGEPLPEDPAKVHLDHDHRHCPPGRSCGLCRRGLAHDPCNRLIGLARDDPARLRRIADELERTLLRIGPLLAGQPVLFAVPDEAYVAPRRPAPNGHRKDPDPGQWKAVTLW